MEWTLNGEWVRWREGGREAFDLCCDVIHLRSSTESGELISTLFPLPLQSLSHSSELSLSFSPPHRAMQWSWNVEIAPTKLDWWWWAGIVPQWHTGSWGKRKLARPVRFLSRLQKPPTQLPLAFGVLINIPWWGLVSLR